MSLCTIVAALCGFVPSASYAESLDGLILDCTGSYRHTKYYKHVTTETYDIKLRWVFANNKANMRDISDGLDAEYEPYPDVFMPSFIYNSTSQQIILQIESAYNPNELSANSTAYKYYDDKLAVRSEDSFKGRKKNFYGFDPFILSRETGAMVGEIIFIDPEGYRVDGHGNKIPDMETKEEKYFKLTCKKLEKIEKAF